MDSRKRKRDEKAETHKITKIVKEVDNCVEDYSGIMLRERSRKVSKDGLD